MEMRVLARNIVVLAYAPDNCRVRVVSLCEAHEGIEVHCGTGEWKRNGQTFKVGEHRPLAPEDQRGVIGVYDRSRNDHMSHLMEVMYEATSMPCACCAG